jgi:hypothetical protein
MLNQQLPVTASSNNSTSQKISTTAAEEEALSGALAQTKINKENIVEMSREVLEPAFRKCTVYDPDKVVHKVNHPRTAHFF